MDWLLNLRILLDGHCFFFELLLSKNSINIMIIEMNKNVQITQIINGEAFLFVLEQA